MSSRDLRGHRSMTQMLDLGFRQINLSKTCFRAKIQAPPCLTEQDASNDTFCLSKLQQGLFWGQGQVKHGQVTDRLSGAKWYVIRLGSYREAQCALPHSISFWSRYINEKRLSQKKLKVNTEHDVTQVVL